MADNLNVNAIGKSDAEIAYQLFRDVAKVEQREISPNGTNPADREYIIKTFAQCMWAIKGPNYNL